MCDTPSEIIWASWEPDKPETLHEILGVIERLQTTPRHLPRRWYIDMDEAHTLHIRCEEYLPSLTGAFGIFETAFHWQIPPGSQITCRRSSYDWQVALERRT